MNRWINRFIGVGIFLMTFSGCGGGQGGSGGQETPQGYCKVFNNSSYELREIYTRTLNGSSDWEIVTGTLQNGEAVVVKSSLGPKELKFSIPFGSGRGGGYSWKEITAPTSIEINKEQMAVFEIMTNYSVITSYTQNPPTSGSGGGSNGGGSCESCTSDPIYTGWLNQCQNNMLSQAPCYCAAAYVKKCCGDSTWVNDYNTAASLGTRCW